MPSLLGRVGSRSTVSKDYKCTVQLLDDAQTMTVDFKKNDNGDVILDYICDMLNIAEKDYFGLRYVDSTRHRYWLDTNKPILRQVKSGSSIVFAFRVKYYPSDPTIINEELTRYFLALQLKRDLLHGRLYCPQSDAAVLGAYILQGEVGDYDPMEHAGNYVSQFKLFLNQTPKLEEKIAFEHQKLRGKGLTPADADLQFLKKACTLDTYGYYPYTIKDPKAGQVYMGATPHGVLVYQTHRKLHHIKWNDIVDFDYAGKDFFIYPKPEYFDYLAEHNLDMLAYEVNNDTTIQEKNGDAVGNHTETTDQGYHSDHNASKNGTKKRPALKFNCPSGTFCKHLWKYMMAQQAFFTKHKANEVKPIAIRRGPFFRRTTFRYTGRVLEEIKEGPSPKRAEPSFERIHIQRQMPRDERNAPWANKFHTLPRATKPVQESAEVKRAPAQSKEAPEQSTRGNLTLDTTVQMTPVTTPMSGLSPASGMNGTALDTSITTSSAGESNRVSSASGYKQDMVTVTLKHIEPLDTENLKYFESEKQRPLGTSTPIPDKKNESKYAVEKQRNGTSVTSGLSTKPSVTPKTTEVTHMASESIQQSPTRRGGGIGRALIKTVLSGLMFTILLIGLIIVIMEYQDPNFREYLHQVPGEDVFRHEYYEPTRQRALDWYQQHFVGQKLEE